MKIKKYKNTIGQIIVTIILFILVVSFGKMTYYAYKSLDDFGEKDYYNALTDHSGSTKALNIYAISSVVDTHIKHSKSGKNELVYYLVAYKHFPKLDIMSVDDILVTKAYPGEFEEYFTIIEIDREDKEILKILGKKDLSKNPYKVKVSVDDRPWKFNKIPTKYGVVEVDLSNKFVSIDSQKSTYYAGPIILLILVVSLVFAIRKLFCIIEDNVAFREKIYEKFPELERDEDTLETKSSYVNEKLGIYIYKDHIIFIKGKYKYFYLKPETLYPKKIKILIIHEKTWLKSIFKIRYGGISKLIGEVYGTTDDINIKIPFVFSKTYGDEVIDYLREKYSNDKSRWIKDKEK